MTFQAEAIYQKYHRSTAFTIAGAPPYKKYRNKYATTYKFLDGSSLTITHDFYKMYWRDPAGYIIAMRTR